MINYQVIVYGLQIYTVLRSGKCNFRIILWTVGMSEDRDMDYVREMYPMTFSRLQELVEKECNRQEFAGSMMYDEYPDKLGISRIVQNIFNEIKKDEENCVGDECTKYPDDTWLKDIITVLLLNEMYRRRRRRNGRLM